MGNVEEKHDMTEIGKKQNKTCHPSHNEVGKW